MNPITKRTDAVLARLMGSRWRGLLNQIPRDVLVSISPEAASNPQGQLITTFTMNLLLRLHPVVSRLYVEISKDSPSIENLARWRKETLISSLEAMYESVKPPVKLCINRPLPEVNPACHIRIGRGRHLSVPGVRIGCNNWIAMVSSSHPVELTAFINPVGAYAAATLAVSETWKRILFRLQNEIQAIRITPLDGTQYFSTFDYSQSGDGPNPALPERIGIGRLTIIGLGAGGGAAAYTLATLPGLQGLLNLIEPDEVEPSNLNRYVFAVNIDATKRRSKVSCVCDLFASNSKIRLRVWFKPYSEAKNDLEIEDYRHVVSAVHSRHARRELQYETPRVLWDGGATEQGDFFIWRIILGETQCMVCKHPLDEDESERQQAEQFSELLGLKPEVWLRKMTNNEAFTTEEIAIIESRFRGQKAAFDLPRSGQRCSEWFANQCGRLELPELDEEIPIPFVPVMAGVLLAGEVIKESLFPDHVLKGYYWNNLAARFNPRLLPRVNRPRKGCKFCKDRIFLDQYARRWRK